MRIESLTNDLKDGTKLLALLEVLSGMKLPTAKGRVLRRPQQLQHCPRVPEEQKGKIPRADTAIISVTDVTIDLVED